ncbi:unnamed protein product [Dicrocoelium dendriticum]|nr:unnamed protein product [Dicrocoelium dendriticum]
MSINDLGAVHGRCDSTTVPASTLAYMRDLLVHLAPSSMAFIQPQYAHLRRFFAACSNDCASTTAWQNGLVARNNQKIREQNYHPAAINTVRLNSPGVYRACQITEMRCPNWEGTTIGFCAPLASQRRDIVPTDEFATEVAKSSLSNNPTEINKDAEPWTNQGTMFPPEVAKCPPQRSAGADYDEQVDMGKRYRTSYSPKQIELLEKTYQAERYISRPQRNKLAQELKLPENTIKVWFQNRRMKEKRQALMLPTVAGESLTRLRPSLWWISAAAFLLVFMVYLFGFDPYGWIEERTSTWL